MISIHIDLQAISIFLAVLLRVGLVVFLLPIFSGQQVVPTMVKAGFCLALSLLVYPGLRSVVQPIPTAMGDLVIVVLAELITAMVLALSCILVMASFELAGEIVSFLMGISFAQVADPQHGAQSTLLSSWFSLVAMLLFFDLNGHHHLLRAIVESFHTIPLGGGLVTELTFGRITTLAGMIFLTAIKLAAPVMLVLLLLNVGLGLMSKFSPQMNILTTSFPISILLGLLFMGFSVTTLGDAMSQILGQMVQFFKIMSG